MKVQRVIAPVGQMQLKSLIEAHVVSVPHELPEHLAIDIIVK